MHTTVQQPGIPKVIAELNRHTRRPKREEMVSCEHVSTGCSREAGATRTTTANARRHPSEGRRQP